MKKPFLPPPLQVVCRPNPQFPGKNWLVIINGDFLLDPDTGYVARFATEQEASDALTAAMARVA